MPNNSNNSNQGWRQGLGEFEDVAGNNLELTTAWEKLQEKKNVRQPVFSKKWYWLAAACLTAVLLIFAGLINKETHQGIEPEMVQTITPQKAGEANTVINSSPATLIENKQQYIKTKNTVSKPVYMIKSNPSPEPLLVVEERNNPVQLIALIDTIAKQPLPAIATAKKIKLVHINEVNQPQQGIVKEEGKPYFPITYQTKQVYTNNASNSKKEKDNIIRIKLN